MSREYPERPLLGVGGVIIHEGRALIVRRASEPLKGEWSIPGGLVELGEKLVDAVQREVQEETGLTWKRARCWSCSTVSGATTMDAASITMCSWIIFAA